MSDSPRREARGCVVDLVGGKSRERVKLGLFGIPVWRIWLGGLFWGTGGGRWRVLTKTLISMGFGEMGLFGSSISALWGWRWG